MKLKFLSIICVALALAGCSGGNPSSQSGSSTSSTQSSSSSRTKPLNQEVDQVTFFNYFKQIYTTRGELPYESVIIKCSVIQLPDTEYALKEYQNLVHYVEYPFANIPGYPFTIPEEYKPYYDKYVEVMGEMIPLPLDISPSLIEPYIHETIPFDGVKFIYNGETYKEPLKIEVDSEITVDGLQEAINIQGYVTLNQEALISEFGVVIPYNELSVLATLQFEYL